MLLATGHPRGLDHLYIEVGRLLSERGIEIPTPADGESWIEGELGRRWIRYHEGLAMLTDDERPLHTHGAEVMARILAEDRPDLVLADHGYAGAAIERGIETISIADVNDPALVVARALGRTEIVVVMDDNVAADAYWPCFQAIGPAAPLTRRAASVRAGVYHGPTLLPETHSRGTVRPREQRAGRPMPTKDVTMTGMRTAGVDPTG